MSTEENKAVVRRFYEALASGDLERQLEFIAEDLTDHAVPSGMPQGKAGFQQFMAPYNAALTDTRITVEQMLAEGDLVAAQFTARATHRGELMGIAPTGKTVTITGTDINRVVGGKIVEHWGENDVATLMQQLGVGQPG